MAKGNTTKVASIDRRDPDGFGRWIARHLEWMQVHNYSKHTVERREPSLVYFARWCEMRGVLRPRDVTKPIVERYQRHLFYYRQANGRPLSWASQVNGLNPIKVFFSWMARQNALLWNPASDIEFPKLPKRLPRAVLSAFEAEAVLAQPDLSEPQGIRDRAILEVLYSTGIRRHELAGLELLDVDTERGTLTVRLGKGKKDRVVPIGERALGWIAKYLDAARPALVVPPDHAALFLNERGERLAAPYLTNLMRGYIQRAKVGKTGACHIFRHSMATLMLEGGAGVRFIQAIQPRQPRVDEDLHARLHPDAQAVHDASPGKHTRPASAAGRGERQQPVELFSSLAAEAADELAGRSSDEGDDDTTSRGDH
jgi:integrase/recombinase XerD